MEPECVRLLWLDRSRKKPYAFRAFHDRGFNKVLLKKSVFILFALWISWGCAATRQTAPSPLPHVRAEYESADFWVQRFSRPGTILLSAERIRDLNRLSLKGKARLADILETGPINRATLVSRLSAIRKQFRTAVYYDHTNRPASAAFYRRISEALAEEAIPAVIEPAFALVTRTTDLRELPTDEVLMQKPDDLAFDSLQYARLECGTAVAILHFTADRQWCLVQTSFAMGWIKALDAAVGTREEIARFAATAPLVIIGEHADVYRDKAFLQFAASMPMGSSLPLNARTEQYSEVLFPRRDEQGKLKIIPAYLSRKAEVHEGFLPYTDENVLRQAFKLYGGSYGWGGMFGGRDCSRFIRDIFRCFGFNMPANSLRQANLNEIRKEDVSGISPSEKRALLRQHDGKPVLLYMRGHIMLLLGVIDDRVYAIHSTWAYRDREWFREATYHVGRVTVSDLSLGEGSSRGSLLDRLLAVTPLY